MLLVFYWAFCRGAVGVVGAEATKYVCTVPFLSENDCNFIAILFVIF